MGQRGVCVCVSVCTLGLEIPEEQSWEGMKGGVQSIGGGLGGSKDHFSIVIGGNAVDVVIRVGRFDGRKMGEFTLEALCFFCELRGKVIGELKKELKESIYCFVTEHPNNDWGLKIAVFVFGYECGLSPVWAGPGVASMAALCSLCCLPGFLYDWGFSCMFRPLSRVLSASRRPHCHRTPRGQDWQLVLKMAPVLCCLLVVTAGPRSHPMGG